uniref:SUMO-activating enzyme subunit 2-like n=1 Tax=Dermatophagoides pteronyssinus TaxID=6956 RepID=A0A6P6XJB2_DERPT|nr:SUMO-activating enzyme subunit 2-like [Dermatophagoides pteronyssinus]
MDDSAFGNVLVVGAGGLGCEILKNISTFSLKRIGIIDIDTIDITNLNRQFFYNADHIGSHKSKVAAHVLTNFLQNKVKINFYVSTIQDFSEEAFKSFDIIVSALDNVKARSYLSKLCIKYDKPLVEGGSTGYNGQSYLIWNLCDTECYDCRKKPTRDNFPVCTIRGLPTLPVHCIAWALMLFNSIFNGTSNSELIYKSISQWKLTDLPRAFNIDNTLAQTESNAEVIDISDNVKPTSEDVSHAIDDEDDIEFLMEENSPKKRRHSSVDFIAATHDKKRK